MTLAPANEIKIGPGLCQSKSPLENFERAFDLVMLVTPGAGRFPKL